MLRILQMLGTWLKPFTKQYNNPQIAKEILERSMKPLEW